MMYISLFLYNSLGIEKYIESRLRWRSRDYPRISYGSPFWLARLSIMMVYIIIWWKTTNKLMPAL